MGSALNDQGPVSRYSVHFFPFSGSASAFLHPLFLTSTAHGSISIWFSEGRQSPVQWPRYHLELAAWVAVAENGKNVIVGGGTAALHFPFLFPQQRHQQEHQEETHKPPCSLLHLPFPLPLPSAKMPRLRCGMGC